MTPPPRRHIPELPPPDRIASVLTGWTRQHWIGLADHLLAALRPYDSPLGARFDLPGRSSWSGRDCDGLEGFARSFLMAACRIAATEGHGCDDLVDRYASGLAAGADPASPEAWPRITDGSQQMVEASLVAISLHESRPWLWDRLDDRTRQHVVGWLSGFIDREPWDNNWLLFQVTAEEFLASVGAEHSRTDIDRGLDRIEDWYRGDGWYTDGGTQNFDYYNAFVMHPYPLLWARMAERSGIDTTDRLLTYRERLREFLGQFQYFVGADGAPVLHGRSTIYRMAMLAPFWTGALADATPLSPGRTRTVCSRVMRHWVERGVPDEYGLLSMGWHHRFLRMTQPYSGPGSPYWASKAFLGLLLPQDHPVWTDREAGLPVDGTDLVEPMPAPGLLVHATRHDKIVRVVNHGSDHAPPPSDDPSVPEPAVDAQYARYGFSNRTGPDLELTSGEPPVDNGVHLVAPDGRFSRRGRIHRLGFGADHASSWSPAVWPASEAPDPEAPDPEGLEQLPVEVTSIVYGCHELRCIRVTGASTGAGPTAAVAGGYALAADVPPTAVTGTDDLGRSWALATRADGTTSTVWGLAGCRGAEIRTASGANPFGPCSATPVVELRPEGGPALVLVALTQETVVGSALPHDVVQHHGPDTVRVRLPGSPWVHEIRFDLDGPVVTRGPVTAPTSAAAVGKGSR